MYDELFNDVSDYVETLRKCSTYFRDLFDPAAPFRFDEPFATRARALSNALVASGATANFWPLIFATRLEYPANGELYCRVVDLCERFSARVYAICANRPNAARSSLGYLARELHAGKDPDDVVRAIAAKLWQFAPDDQVRANFAPGIKWYMRRSHKYILFEYELAAVREPG
ncbi:hypothetical protein [Protaetiibacter larvae]|uniref:hypothetical protein n=1 Tax=Protaetiibacter larvae TaxID=2592654 RepID=UPI00143DF338|nr:hypothetical protein [Protaetiibacter larvae]